MKNFIEKNKEWLKTFGSLLVVAISTTWFMSHQIHTMELRLNEKIGDVDSRLGNMINTLDKRLTVVETVLLMQGAPIKALTQVQAEELKAKL
jgi:hypothetical protein